MAASMINLFKGSPSPDLLAADILLEASKRVLSDPGLYVSSLSYGPSAGYDPLRKAVATWLSGYYSSSWTCSERICISGGASQNLACILQVFTDPLYTRKIFMVVPTYFLATRMFEDSGFAEAFEGVPEDGEGIDLDYLANCLAEEDSKGHESKQIKKPKANQKLYRYVLYCVPTFSNPSGKCMSLLHRQKLIRLARRYDMLVISDDVYDCLRWKGENGLVPRILPRLVDVDHELDGGPTSDFGNAVSNGSFSKILGPGVRTGWAEATPIFVKGLASCGSTASGGAPSQLAASFVAEVLTKGDLQRHLQQTVIPRLQRRCQVAKMAVRNFFPSLDKSQHSSQPLCKTVFDVSGGFFIWVPLPRPLLAYDVAERAMKQAGVIVNKGDIFSVPSRHAARHLYPEALRICFAWEQEEAISVGISRLGQVIHNMLDETTASSHQQQGFRLTIRHSSLGAIPIDRTANDK